MFTFFTRKSYENTFWVEAPTLYDQTEPIVLIDSEVIFNATTNLSERRAFTALRFIGRNDFVTEERIERDKADPEAVSPISGAHPLFDVNGNYVVYRYRRCVVSQTN